MIFIILNDNPKSNKLIQQFKQRNLIPRDANVEQLHIDMDRKDFEEVMNFD